MQSLADQFTGFARMVPLPIGCKPPRKSLLDELRALRAELIEELISRHAA
jgi:hypothetical protein